MNMVDAEVDPGKVIVTRVPVVRDQCTVATAILVRSTADVVVVQATCAKDRGLNTNWVPPHFPLMPFAFAPAYVTKPTLSPAAS